MKPKYKVELSEEQCYHVEKALELYCRMQMGQFWSAAELFFSEPNHRELREALNALAPLIFPQYPGNGSASHGITSDQVPEGAKIAYDLQCVLRHRRAWDENPAGGWSVNYQDPLHTAKHPLPKVEACDGSGCKCSSGFCHLKRIEKCQNRIDKK